MYGTLRHKASAVTSDVRMDKEKLGFGIARSKKTESMPAASLIDKALGIPPI